jgi:hypothetical protein
VLQAKNDWATIERETSLISSHTQLRWRLNITPGREWKSNHFLSYWVCMKPRGPSSFMSTKTKLEVVFVVGNKLTLFCFRKKHNPQIISLFLTLSLHTCFGLACKSLRVTNTTWRALTRELKYVHFSLLSKHSNQHT